METESLKDDAPETSSTYCSSCLEDFDKQVLYRCSSCDSGVDSKNYLCESCILWHLRRNHEIIDDKGYPPATCNTHKMMSVLFCNDCDFVLCRNCITDHSGHSFQSVDTKSSEIRRSIFGYLNKIEEKSKPLKHLETVSEELSTKVCDFRSSLSEENLVETLKSLYNGVVESNLASWIKIVDEKIEKCESQMSVEGSAPETSSIGSSTGSLQKFVRPDVFRKHIRGVRDEVDNDTKCLKKMLLLSNGKCITQFNEAKSGVKSSIEKCEMELRKHACLEWSTDVNDIILNSISDALSSLKLYLIQNIGIEIEQPLEETSFETDTKTLDV